MPVFKPFRGIRPHRDIESTFPTHPLDNFTQEEIAEKAQVENTYINMIKPYVVSKSKDIDRNLRKIRSTFEELLEEKNWFRTILRIIFMNRSTQTNRFSEAFSD
jgi:uncharacterized protein (DUF1015 family)